MLHDMYDAMNRVSSIFMIYEYNGCACKPSVCLAETNKSLASAGESKCLTDVEDSRLFDCSR